MEVKVALGESVLMQITSDMQWRWRRMRPSAPRQAAARQHAQHARHAAGTWRRLACLSKPRARTLGMRGLPGLSGTVKNNPVSYHYSSATPMHFQFEQMQFQLQL